MADKLPSKKQTIESLELIKEIFEGLGHKIVLTDGLVLGYGRFKDIMEWDTDDIDVGIFEPVSEKAKWEAARIFKEKGYSFPLYGNTSRFQRHKPFNEGSFHTSKKGVRIAIEFYHAKGEFFYALTLNELLMKREYRRWFEEPQEVDFIGSKYLMPNDIEDYLNTHYGKDWRTYFVKDTKEWKIEREKKEKYFQIFVPAHVVKGTRPVVVATLRK